MGKTRINKYLISKLPNQQGRIEANFRFLSLNGMLTLYKKIAKKALEESWTPFELIEHLQLAELNWAETNRTERWIKQAHFDSPKTLEEFDFSFPKKINKTLIFELASCRFIENAENIIFLGQTGVGKTHLAQSLGLKAIYNGFDVRFLTLRSLHELIDKVRDSKYELRKLLTNLAKPKLLILDEVALFQPDEILAEFLSELLLNRHLKNSTIFTSNKSFSQWTNAFGDKHSSTMIIDRINQKAHPVLIEGDSYRIKDRLGKTGQSTQLFPL